jgi:two-component system response regulator AtoC
MNGAILIIEDEAILAKNMRTYLERNDYEVECAGSAEEGLGRLDSFAPDAVVLDFNLPGMDGLQAARAHPRARPGDGGDHGHRPRPRGDGGRGDEGRCAGLPHQAGGAGQARLLLERGRRKPRKDSALDYYRGATAKAPRSAPAGWSPGMRDSTRCCASCCRPRRSLQDADAPAVLVRAKPAPARSWWRARCTTAARAAASPSSS